jgi:hypothetical protein
MKKQTLILLTFCSFIFHTRAQIFTAKEGSTAISFFSSAPLENIEALNKGAVIILNAGTNNLQMRISIQNFKFKNALMEEHFNENYLESTKYPNAEFKGKINEVVDYTQDGENKVTVTGTLDMHGVKKEVTINGSLKKTGELISLSSKFQIKIADYNIKVPSMYIQNIAEVVDVTFSTTLEPFKKK